MVVIAQLVARRFHNPKVANSILNHRVFLNVRRLILRLSISHRNHDFSFLPKTSRSLVAERFLFPPATRKTRAQFPASEYSPLQAIRPPRLTAALSQSRRSELLQCHPTSRLRVSQVSLLFPCWRPEDQRISLVHRFASAKTPKRNRFRNRHHMDWHRIVPWRTVFDGWLTRGSLGVLLLAMCQAKATRKSA